MGTVASSSLNSEDSNYAMNFFLIFFLGVIFAIFTFLLDVKKNKLLSKQKCKAKYIDYTKIKIKTIFNVIDMSGICIILSAMGLVCYKSLDGFYLGCLLISAAVIVGICTFVYEYVKEKRKCNEDCLESSK